MEEERRKARRLVIGLLLLCLCIALVCFGVVVYLVLMSRAGELAGSRLASISTILVLVGIFFLVLAFGYLLPILISYKK